MNDDFARAAWLLRSGWYTSETGRFVRWYYKGKNGSTLGTNFDEACKVQKRRDAATKNAPAGKLAEACHLLYLWTQHCAGEDGSALRAETRVFLGNASTPTDAERPSK